MAPRGALEVGLDETNVPCETPLNKEAETSQFTPPRNRRARFIVIEGGERIISALRPGRNLCGWSTYATIPTQEPSQRYPTEARLEDEAGMLIAAYSDYAESGSPSSTIMSPPAPPTVWPYEAARM